MSTGNAETDALMTQVAQPYAYPMHMLQANTYRDPGLLKPYPMPPVLKLMQGQPVVQQAQPVTVGHPIYAPAPAPAAGGSELNPLTAQVQLGQEHPQMLAQRGQASSTVAGAVPESLLYPTLALSRDSDSNTGSTTTAAPVPAAPVAMHARAPVRNAPVQAPPPASMPPASAQSSSATSSSPPQATSS